MAAKLPIESPEFWNARLAEFRTQPYRAIANVDEAEWARIQQESKTLLHDLITPGQKVLDVGCAYGPLLETLPECEYTGVDISNGFLDLGRLLAANAYPSAKFLFANARRLPFKENHVFDWAVCRSMEGTITENVSTLAWRSILDEVCRVSKKVLVFNYGNIQEYKIHARDPKPKTARVDKPLKVWFPKFFTEAHRESWQGAMLVEALRRHGVECVLELSGECDLAFCGSFFLHEKFREALSFYPYIPTVHYNWDLYPFQIEGRHLHYGNRWKTYIKELTKANRIVVPSRCTALRTRQYIGVDAFVARSSVRLFDAPVASPGDYILDPVRKYPDHNNELVRQACNELNLPLVESKNGLSLDEFRRTVAEARIIVSAQHEASTGGLTLLEGYALGKPVLLSNSPYHGAVDYFDNRATYFQWDSLEDLKQRLKQLWDDPPKLNRTECYTWVRNNFSEDNLAADLAANFREVLGLPPRVFKPVMHSENYQPVHSYHDDTGFITWRKGTGGNVELLNIAVYQPGQGHGKNLLRKMLSQLLSEPPFCTVFGFTRVANLSSRKFYESAGFDLQHVNGVYNDGEAILFNARFTHLVSNLGVEQ